MTDLVLSSFWRSGTAHRVRIGLELKGLAVTQDIINLGAKAQHSPAYRAHNPQGFVPALTVADGTVLTQSVAILEYLDEVYPDPPLLPHDPAGRALARALALTPACDIHPLNNQRVLAALRADYGLDQAALDQWCRTWVDSGFAALEALLTRTPWAKRGPWAHGAAPGLADCCLVPQVYAATDRYGTDLTPYPRLAALAQAAADHPAFQRAHPLAQPDAPVSPP